MKMFLIQIVDAYPTFMLFAQQRYTNFELSYKLSKAVKDIQEKVKFYTDEEKKLVDEYAKKEANGQVSIRDGNIIDFDDPEKSKAYHENITKLRGTAVDIFEPIVIKKSDMKNMSLSLTPMQILSLNGLITFNMEE